MFFIMCILTFLIGAFGNRDILFIASSLFAIAGSIESFSYRYFKNK